MCEFSWGAAVSSGLARETVMLVISAVSGVPKQAFFLLFDWKRDWEIEGLIPRNSEGSLRLSGLSSKYYK